MRSSASSKTPATSFSLASIARPRVGSSQWPKGTTRVARTMFADAQRDGLVTANPFTSLRLETPKGRKDLQTLSEAEIRALADAAVDALGGEYGPQFRAALIFLAYVGCRPGLAALVWPRLPALTARGFRRQRPVRPTSCPTRMSAEAGVEPLISAERES
jgi:hypothetical protein